MGGGGGGGAIIRGRRLIEGRLLFEEIRYIYIYISLKMSAMLPSDSEKQSMNDVRQREGC